jgi:glycosyltransferase involved in cell wall biosynthesis
VHWLGFVRGEEKWKIVQGCDFFVLSSYSENFGIAVLEALACGLFVIVSPNVGLAAEISTAGLGRLAAVDEAALADAIASVAVSANFEAAARASRRAFVEQRFSWAAATDRLIAAYEDALYCRN